MVDWNPFKIIQDRKLSRSPLYRTPITLQSSRWFTEAHSLLERIEKYSETEVEAHLLKSLKKMIDLRIKGAYYIIVKSDQVVEYYYSGDSSWTPLMQGARKYYLKPEFPWLTKEHEIIKMGDE